MMKLLKKIFNHNKNGSDGGGLIIFHTTHDALKAEKTMRNRGEKIRLVAPPVNKREGCDLAIEFDLIERLKIERLLNIHSLPYIAVTEMASDCPRPSDIVERINFPGNFLMIRAGNMKLTINTETATIVNISGGGCPDVPYLYRLLIGKKIEEAPSPDEHGYTLCALMLGRAFREAKKMAVK